MRERWWVTEWVEFGRFLGQIALVLLVVLAVMYVARSWVLNVQDRRRARPGARSVSVAARDSSGHWGSE